MQIFYVPDINGSICVLDPNESKHSVRVLRMAKGDNLRIVDGKGSLYEGIIINPDPAGCQVKITSVTRDFEKRNYHLNIAISPIKNPERFEWFVEKSVEIGIDEITPLICRNTEKPGIKRDRLNNIIVSAMKQSVKAFRPVLNEAFAFNDFIKSDIRGIRMIAHCNPAIKRYKMDQVYKKDRDAVILIGPEGDFSEEEINLALDNGFKPVDFGSSRLRTETAGIAACHSVYFINQINNS
jgi:16S rRNA (uracil1498-N3)-methyltransferase